MATSIRQALRSHTQISKWMPVTAASLKFHAKRDAVHPPMISGQSPK